MNSRFHSVQVDFIDMIVEFDVFAGTWFLEGRPAVNYREGKMIIFYCLEFMQHFVDYCLWEDPDSRVLCHIHCVVYRQSPESSGRDRTTRRNLWPVGNEIPIRQLWGNGSDDRQDIGVCGHQYCNRILQDELVWVHI
jgi:hypothetical protein